MSLGRGRLASPSRLAWIYVLGFALFVAAGAALLPERLSFDTTAMVEGIEDKSGLDTSYQRMSQTIELLTYEGTTLLVAVIGAYIIRRTVSRLRTRASLAVFSLTLIAAAPLCLMRPQKEFYVLLLTLGVVAALRRYGPRGSVAATVVLYVAYALMLGRDYYLLIAAAFVALTLATVAGRTVRWTAAAAIIVVGFAIPMHVLEPIQLARDALNLYRVLDSSEPGNRTAFMNPIDTVGWIPFLINYAYAAVRLNFPIVFSVAPQELFLSVFSVVWFALIWIGLRARAHPPRIAATLVLSHMVVLWMFEPDLGSYLRHMSSLLVLLQPLLWQLDSELLGEPTP